MRVVIVGNAPVTRDHADRVDAADLVIRFNVPRTWYDGTGRRFDAWVIANGVAGRAFVRNRTFADAPFRDLPSEIRFPRAVEVHADLRATRDSGFLKAKSEHDVAERILKRNGLRQRWLRFDAAFYRRCLDRLRSIDPLIDPTSIPSAGFLATNHVLETRPGAEVTLVGFTFEGWPGHPWAVEAAFVGREVETGRLTLVPS